MGGHCWPNEVYKVIGDRPDIKGSSDFAVGQSLSHHGFTSKIFLKMCTNIFKIFLKICAKFIPQSNFSNILRLLFLTFQIF